MNVEALTELAEKLSRSKTFSMLHTFHPAKAHRSLRGQPANITGHALYDIRSQVLKCKVVTLKVMQVRYDLTFQQAWRLCIPHYESGAYEASAIDASNCVLYLAKSGKVNWQFARGSLF